MNYYIQGNKEKAEEIKAAFEELGINVLGFGFADKAVVYCSIGECVQYLPYSINLMNILYSHPDYKELELAVKSKFKVGDWIVSIDDEGDVSTEKIVSFSRNKVLLVDTDGCRTEYPKTELNGFHLWSIADAKDGDVLVAHEVIGLFKEIDGLNIRCHFSYHYMNTPMVFTNELHNKMAFRPATKDERELLFAKMKEEGYQWDSNKEELRKIQHITTNPRISEERKRTMKIDKAIEVLKNHNENDVCPKSELYQAIESAILVMTFFDDVMNKFGKED